jgi:CubicO group peptidase (beta-lactamase class C family)/D-alanyl-D-alanine dipeptidase
MYTLLRVSSTLLLAGLFPPATQAQEAINPSGRYQNVAQALTPVIERARAQHDIPGISIALVEGSRVVWARGFGWADSAAGKPAAAGTVYRVGSVSKLFTDIAVMQLVERGELQLDAPIGRYLPDFHPRNPFGGEITVRELTSHRSGLTREPPVGNYFDDTGPTLAATVASLNRTTLVYPPGTHTKYSNAGIAVLGYVLEKTRGESFSSYVRHAVLDPIGMPASAFEPLPQLKDRLAKGYMWTLDGRRFEAPTFQLGLGPAGSLYTSVLDLSRFMSVLFAGGALPNGNRLLAKATLDSMWTPQYAKPGATEGFGIGFYLGKLEGHRRVGHGGAIYGFATSLETLPDDSLGVVVVATLDVQNPVTDDIAETAIRMMLAEREGKPLPPVPTSSPLTKAQALNLIGRYIKGAEGVDLEEYAGRLYMTPVAGGMRSELRRVDSAGTNTTRAVELASDDQPGLRTRVHVLEKGKVVIGSDTLVRLATPGSDAVALTLPKPAADTAPFAGLIGEYGWDHDILYIREKDGKLNALIEWFFEYPLTRISRDVYRFPSRGLYDGQEIVFQRGSDGRATIAVAATVPFKRRTLPGDDDRVNFRITPVKPVATLRQTALSATPPEEPGDFRASDLVELKSLDPSIKYDIRYATSNNFMGTPFYNSAHAFMQQPAAEAVARAAKRLKRLGYGLLVHDSYRPWYVTKMFWDGTPVDKHLFVADPSEGSRHNRGCAVDITLYELKTGEPVRMTGGYDEMSDRSYPLYPGGTSLQRWHRDLLRHAMEAEGFTVYQAEWWHFDYKDWRQYRIQNLTFEQLANAASQNSPQPSR